MKGTNLHSFLQVNTMSIQMAEQTHVLKSTYYCPLNILIYTNESETPTLKSGRDAAPYRDLIRTVIEEEDAVRGGTLADYYWGSPTVAQKLEALTFAVCKFEGKLLGCFAVDHNAPFTPAEEAEIRDWLMMQCTDGYGERLEQYAFSAEDGVAYLSFRSAEGDCMILSAKEMSYLF